MINRANQCVHSTVFHPKPAQVLERFFFAQIDKLTFDSRADYDRFGAEMMLRVILDELDILRRGICSIALGYGSEIGFSHVTGEKSRLRGQEKEIPRDGFFLWIQRRTNRRLSGIKMRQKFFGNRTLDFRALFTGTDFFLQSIVALLKGREIGQHQLGVNDFDIANRIDRGADVMHIRIGKAAHHLHDRVDFADVTEKLIAESFAGTGAFDQTGDVYELDRGRHNFFRARHLTKLFQTCIGHGHDADVRIDGAEGIILRRRFVCARDGVEQRRFPDIRQSNNSGAKHDYLSSVAAVYDRRKIINATLIERRYNITRAGGP